ncbi:divalent cation transporter [Azorhizobium oxalatiphilum]|uniref:Divalent cation transporter n=1 Tax=Azorhizobium oxalatiphilum TaxID=980631 RepID=A0A917C3A8_9HYPH|nr:TolC family protein [Azorhizobium oxalatiphilum]GGF68644.1 divalent cation transporter [Azorhizobium oxalatiphilum]
MFQRALAATLGAAIVLLPATIAHAASPPAPLTLTLAIQRAIASNPRMTIAERDIGMSGGRRMQAGVMPNPALSLELDGAFGTNAYQGLDQAETTLQISQLIELGGKREARVASAAADQEAMKWEREAVRLQVMAETTGAFVGVLAAQRRVSILTAQVNETDGFMPMLQKRVEAGASSPSEVSRARLAAELARVDLDKAKAALITARRELALQMGQPEPRFGAVSGNLLRVAAPPALQSVLREAMANPQLTKFTAVKSQRRAQVATERARAVPDVTVGAGWRYYNDTRDSGVVVSLGMPIPIFDQNQGSILEAQENLRRAEAEEQIARNTLISMTGRAYDGLKAAYEEVQRLRATAIPDARATYEGIQSGYGEGRYTLLELLDGQNALSETALRELEALVAFHTSLATLEGLIGRPVHLSQGKTK